MKTSTHSQEKSPAALILGATLLTLIAVAVFALSPERTPQPAASLAVPQFIWIAGEHRAYELDLTSQVQLGVVGADAPADLEQRIAGTLHLKVYSVAETEVELGLQLSEPSLRVNGERDVLREAEMATAFGARFGRDGRPLNFSFPANMSEDVASQLEELVRSFQVIVPVSAQESWETKERHGSGRYAADYQVVESGLRKTKSEYLSGAPMYGESDDLDDAKTRLVRSVAEVELDPAASWIDRVSLEEELVVVTGIEAMARSETRAELRSVVLSLPGSLARAKGVEALLAAEAAGLNAVKAKAREAQRVPASPADIASFRETVAAFAASDGLDVDLLHAIARMIARFPELAPLMTGLIDEDRHADRVCSGLIHCLELAGHKEAQVSLVVLLRDQDRSQMNRVRALVALGGVDDPSSATLQQLWAATEDRAHHEAEDRANTALLSLGRLAASMRDSQHEEYGAMQLGLQRALDVSYSDDSRVIALKAIGNSRDADLEPKVLDHLRADSAVVRAAAAEAVGAMDCAESLPILTRSLGSERNGRVRAMIAASLSSMSHRDESTFREVQRLVRDEGDDSARFAMVCYLADHLDEFPDARSTLLSLMENETEERTLRYIAGKIYKVEVSR